MTGLNTSVQLHAPEKERSRVLSIYVLSLSVFYPIGAIVQSTMVRHWGVPAVSAGAAALFVLLLGVVSFFRPQFWTAMGSIRA
jgi:hypothetical protein